MERGTLFLTNPDAFSSLGCNFEAWKTDHVDGDGVILRCFGEPSWAQLFLAPRCMLGFMASSAALPLGRGFTSGNRTSLFSPARITLWFLHHPIWLNIYIYYMNHGEPPMFICSAPYANSLVSAQTPNSYWHDSLARLFDPLFSRLSHWNLQYSWLNFPIVGWRKFAELFGEPLRFLAPKSIGFDVISPCNQGSVPMSRGV